jgi:hypothetical protein
MKDVGIASLLPLMSKYGYTLKEIADHLDIHYTLYYSKQGNQGCGRK